MKCFHGLAMAWTGSQPIALRRALWLSVPLSHSVNPSVAQAGDGETITVYAREVVSHANAAKRASLPALVFLQGGYVRPARSHVRGVRSRVVTC